MHDQAMSRNRHPVDRLAELDRGRHDAGPAGADRLDVLGAGEPDGDGGHSCGQCEVGHAGPAAVEPAVAQRPPVRDAAVQAQRLLLHHRRGPARSRAHELRAEARP